MDYERISTHDKVRNHGFEVDPELLAHDLAILTLHKMREIDENTVDVVIYETYKEVLSDFRVLIDDKMRYDANFNQ